MRKKKKNTNTVFLPWVTDENAELEVLPDGTKKRNKRFVGLPHSLLNNKKFLKLKPSAKVVLIYMLDWASGKQTTKYTHSMAKRIMSGHTFISAVNQLCESGFIDIIEKGDFNHRPNVYQFSEKWKN